MTVRGRFILNDHFYRPQTVTTTPAGYPFGWTLKKTASGGSPTMTTTSAGLVTTLAATSEAEVMTAYQNDILAFNINNLRSLEFTANLAGIDAVTTVVMGLGNTENDTVNSVGSAVWFRVNGATSTTVINAETYDGTTRTTADTLQTVSATNKRFMIDFSQGLNDVRFLIDGQPVATATKFSMPALTSPPTVQLYFQIQKASGTGVGALTLREVELEAIFAD